jgi:hypothetical protein
VIARRSSNDNSYARKINEQNNIDSSNTKIKMNDQHIKAVIINICGIDDINYNSTRNYSLLDQF